MHEPGLLNHSRESEKHKEPDPIDEVYEGVDIDIIPDAGRGPRFPLSSENWIIGNDFAHMDERDTLKTSQNEMDAQMYEELDKETSLDVIPLPRGEDGWTTPSMLFGSESFETMAPEFNPCIDLTNAPSWPNLEALLASPDSGYNSSKTAADQLVHNGGKVSPINMRSGENGTTSEMESSDTETTFSRESSPVSMISEEQMSDTVRKHSFMNTTPAGQRLIHDQKARGVRFLPVLICERGLKRIKENEKKKTQAKKIGKENQINVEAGVENECDIDHSSGTRNHRQSIKMSSMSRNESSPRRSARIETRRRRLKLGIFKSLPKNSRRKIHGATSKPAL